MNMNLAMFYYICCTYYASLEIKYVSGAKMLIPYHIWK